MSQRWGWFVQYTCGFSQFLRAELRWIASGLNGIVDLFHSAIISCLFHSALKLRRHCSGFTGHGAQLALT
jgi:hypothetical protein